MAGLSLSPLGLAPGDVTRLADLTGLDRLGFPIWQAIRPNGRSLSCHLGKGRTAEQAIASAVGEARECADMEAWRGDVLVAPWIELPHAERSAAPDDFCWRRGDLAANEPIGWILVEGIMGPPLWVPADAIDIDFSRGRDRRIPGSTSGTATAASVEEATLKAVLERIEHDADTRFSAMGPGLQLAHGVEPSTIPCSWFHEACERLAAAGIDVGVDRLPACGNLPAFRVTLVEQGVDRGAYRWTAGSGAWTKPILALSAALLEAIQARAALIAGARDDLPISPYNDVQVVPPTAVRGRRRFPASNWSELPSDASLEVVLHRLKSKGFDRVGRVVVAKPGNGFVTVKVFVPGLGDGTRAPRNQRGP